MILKPQPCSRRDCGRKVVRFVAVSDYVNDGDRRTRIITEPARSQSLLWKSYDPADVFVSITFQMQMLYLYIYICVCVCVYIEIGKKCIYIYIYLCMCVRIYINICLMKSISFVIKVVCHSGFVLAFLFNRFFRRM